MSKINIQDLCDESHRLIRETIKTIGKIQEALLSIHTQTLKIIYKYYFSKASQYSINQL